MSELIAITQAAAILGVSKPHFRTLAQRHDFGEVSISQRSTRWDRKKVEAFLQSRKR